MITEVLMMPSTVMVPALAVMEPRATIEVLSVTVEVLAMPFTVIVPALAVIGAGDTTDLDTQSSPATLSVDDISVAPVTIRSETTTPESW